MAKRKEKEPAGEGLIEIRIKVDRFLNQAIIDEGDFHNQRTKAATCSWLLASILRERVRLLRERSVQ